jgi:hypothetical protein
MNATKRSTIAMRVTGRNAFSLVETLLAAGLGLMVLVLLWSLLSATRSAEAKVSGKAAAVASAQLALEEVTSDLASMTPPDPYQPETTVRVGEDGRSLAFFRCEMEARRIGAVPVVFAVRPTAKACGNFGLWKNGARVGGVTLRELKFEVVANPDGNPFVHLTAVGIGEDLPETRTSPGDLHLIETDIPLTAVSPAALVGLPQAALAACRRAVVYKGQLPAI